MHTCTAQLHTSSLTCPMRPDSVDSRALVDPMFARALKQLSLEAQEYFHEDGLSDPEVFESFLGDPDRKEEELAFETGDVPKLEELLKQHCAAYGQRAEFARRDRAGAFPLGWHEAQSWRETVEQGRRQKRKKGSGG